MDHFHFDFRRAKPFEGALDRFGAAADVGFKDQDQFLELARADLVEERVQVDVGVVRLLIGFAAAAAGFDDQARLALIGDDTDALAGLGYVFEAHDHRRRCWPGFLDAFAAVVKHRLNFAAGFAGNQGVTLAEGAVLHEHRGDWAAGGVQLRFNNYRDPGTVGVGLQLRDLGDEVDRLQQVIDAGLLQGRDRDRDHIAAVVFDHKTVLGELLLYAVRISAGKVALVDSNNNWDAGRLGVVYRLDGLRHDAVVGCDDQHSDIRHLCAAGTHRREGRVARRIDEGDHLAVEFDLVGADVLGDTAGLTGSDFRRSDGIEEARLAVVDVAENGDDGRAGNERGRVVRFLHVFDDLGQRRNFG